MTSFIIITHPTQMSSMWTSIPAHIDPHLSKPRLWLGTNGCIREQYLQWVSCMSGTTI